MKVDIVIAVAERGGVENVICDTAIYLKNSGWKVRIIQLVWEGFCWTPSDISFFPLLYGRSGHNLAELIEAYQLFIQSEEAPDVILATGWPYISYLTRKALVYGNKSAKIISWLHAPVNRYQQAGYGGYDALNYADAHFAISDTIYQEIYKTISTNVFRVYNPVDFSKCPKLKLSDKVLQKKIAYVGRISPEKHIEIILEALLYLDKEWNMDIVGTGDAQLENMLKRKIKKWGINNRVNWLGWKKNPWMDEDNTAEIVVLASEYEGSPLTVIEAMACGKTVISTPVDGIKELIVHGESGYLFEYGNARMLSEILNALEKGMLPVIDKSICKSKVANFEKGIALKNFENILFQYTVEGEKK